jgi:hypothetical protein
MKKLKIECMVSDETYARIKASIYLMRFNEGEESALWDMLGEVQEQYLNTGEENGETIEGMKYEKFKHFIKVGMERDVQKEVREIIENRNIYR